MFLKFWVLRILFGFQITIGDFPEKAFSRLVDPWWSFKLGGGGRGGKIIGTYCARYVWTIFWNKFLLSIFLALAFGKNEPHFATNRFNALSKTRWMTLAKNVLHTDLKTRCHPRAPTWWPLGISSGVIRLSWNRSIRLCFVWVFLPWTIFVR